MCKTLNIAALAALAALTQAAPAPRRDAFSVKQVAGGQKVFSGPIEMNRTYAKYARIGAKPPAVVVKAADDAQQGSVAANPTQFDLSYLCPVTIGGQTLNLDFDTGSADLWVFSTLTPSNEVNGQTEYDPNRSSSAQELNGETWQIGYQDGSGASGVVYADTVVVGGVTATSQAVEAATSVSGQFSKDSTTDGLLGLSFSSGNTVRPNQATTFFDTVKSSLNSQLFTATLKKSAPGSYDFGYIDDSKHQGSIDYVDVDSSQGFWGFTADSYSVGGASGNIGSAIADTGTSLWYLPTAAVQDYYNQVDGASLDQNQGGYTFPCSASLPDISIAIGSGSITVPGSYMNVSPTDNSGQTCFGGIQENTGIGMSIFGDVFLKAAFVVFDESQGSPRLGFAQQS